MSRSCRQCGTSLRYVANYCPNCGVMDLPGWVIQAAARRVASGGQAAQLAREAAQAGQVGMTEALLLRESKLTNRERQEIRNQARQAHKRLRLRE